MVVTAINTSEASIFADRNMEPSGDFRRFLIILSNATYVKRVFLPFLAIRNACGYFRYRQLEQCPPAPGLSYDVIDLGAV